MDRREILNESAEVLIKIGRGLTLTLDLINKEIEKAGLLDAGTYVAIANVTTLLEEGINDICHEAKDIQLKLIYDCEGSDQINCPKCGGELIECAEHYKCVADKCGYTDAGTN